MARQLIEAIRNGNQSQAINILLSDRYGCIDCQTAKRDGTALFWAAAKGFIELVHLLLAKGANVNARTSYNSTPLIAAADTNKHQVMRLLLQQGADVNAQTSSGDTACHLAAYRGHTEAVRVLVAAGAQTDVTNSHFRTAYDDASRQGHSSLLPLLDGAEKAYRKYKQQPSQSEAEDAAAMATIAAGGGRPCCGVNTCGEMARRNSCDCLSTQSLSRESSYEDCGSALVANYDYLDRLQGKEAGEFWDPELLFFPASSSGSLHSQSSFSSLRMSSLPVSHSDLSSSLGRFSEINDLSLASSRTSDRKSVMSKLNIPA